MTLAAVAGSSGGEMLFVGAVADGGDQAAAAYLAADGGLQPLPLLEPNNKSLEAVCIRANGGFFRAGGAANTSAEIAAPLNTASVANYGIYGLAVIPTYHGIACTAAWNAANANDRTAWFVGEPAIIVRSNTRNASTTDDVEFNLSGNNRLFGISTAPGYGMWAVGDVSTANIFRRRLAPEKGDSGWFVEPAPTFKILRSVWVSPVDGGTWAVGDEGTILHRRN